MNECERIGDQLKRSYRGPAWHGPSVRENLEGVTAAMAAGRIWEIVRHIAAWEVEVAAVLDGKPSVTLSGEADWPPCSDVSEEAWQATLSELDQAHAALSDAVARFPEERLSEKVPGRNFPFYGMMHGVVQHNIYHAGQLGLLRKKSH